MARLIEFEDAVAHAGDSAEVVLWFEHDLHCQLMLVRLLDQLACMAPRAVSLVGTGYFLSEGDVRALFDNRCVVTTVMIAVARTAWASFTSPDPTALASYVAGDTAPLPYLAPALRRHLEQFPSTANGLARTENAIVAALAGGPRARPAIFEAARAAEETPYMGDTIFWDYLEALCRGPEPLVGENSGGARLTERGEDVRAGRADAIALRGIDRWLGGVHLASAAAPRRTDLWRWDAARRRLVKQ